MSTRELHCATKLMSNETDINVHVFIDHSRITLYFIRDDVKSATKLDCQNKHGWVQGTPVDLPVCQGPGATSPDSSPTSPATWHNAVCLWSRSKSDFWATPAHVNSLGIVNVPWGHLPKQCFCKAKTLIIIKIILKPSYSPTQDGCIKQSTGTGLWPVLHPELHQGIF